MILPFWNSELYVEISSWFPFGKDYHPVSVNRFHSRTLRNIASSCIDLDGEFFFMASTSTGCIGSLPRENFFTVNSANVLNLGFLLVLGYSEPLEKAVILSLGAIGPQSGLNAGITACSIWNNGIFEGTARVIAIADDDPFYDCTEYLKVLDGVMNGTKNLLGTPGQSYYAEKFGYNRFFIDWEEGSTYDIETSRIMSEFEFDGTREITGGSPREEFPPFMGTAVSIN
ncbi:MAG: hypothetical protein IJG65_09210 [Synergistaceae bacterium]|nr:hypothetical protein [Synergistaceae bacterium]